MNSWIFQGNPDYFDIDAYLSEQEDIFWSVRQRHLAPDMKPGDEVFIWRAAGLKKEISGVVAIAQITGEPKEQPDHAAALHYWISDGGKKSELRVPIHIENRNLGTREVVRGKWLKDDQILSGLRILRLRNETNYRISKNQAQRLFLLCKNTGRDWNREECIAGLWAYSRTYGKIVSRLPGSAVAEVAMRIGRAVTGVYNKVMNFRSIDQRDKRAGLSSTNHLDHEVWDEFYSPDKEALDLEQLEDEYKKLWGSTPVATRSKLEYRDFGEAPDDDPMELREFARRIRKGQAKFRGRLLHLYGGRCAISSWGPENVLEAAHVDPHSTSGVNHSDNGLLLRADLHCLFDDGLLSVHPDKLEVVIDESLKGTEYWSLNGIALRQRADGGQPAKKYLESRWSNRQA